MRFLADESVDFPIVTRLRQDGHDVVAVVDLVPGISDEVVLEMAAAERRILVTADRDFGELVFRRSLLSEGVVLVRLAGLSPERKATTVSETISRHGQELDGVFAVVSPGLFRIRRPSP
jgi:predicted nuclease of predicted toxin-antitoxin system